jgi:hypothetical protein
VSNICGFEGLGRVSQTVSYTCKEVKGKERGVVRIYYSYKRAFGRARQAKTAKPNMEAIRRLVNSSVLFNLTDALVSKQ